MRVEKEVERVAIEKLRVMLIDDDREILELLAEWLGGRGYEVRTLCDGTNAIEMARAFRPHVVVLDGVLRGTTGKAVAESLRAAGFGGRIVFLSGLSRLDLPPDELVLEKPIDLQLLDRTLVDALETEGPPQEGRPRGYASESEIQRR